MRYCFACLFALSALMPVCSEDVSERPLPDVDLSADQQAPHESGESSDAPGSLPQEAQVGDESMEDTLVALRQQVEQLSLQQQLSELQRQRSLADQQAALNEQRRQLEQQQLMLQLAETKHQQAIQELQQLRARQEMELALAQQKADLAMLKQRKEVESERMALESQQLAQQARQIELEQRMGELSLRQMAHQSELEQWLHVQQRHEAELASESARRNRSHMVSTELAYLSDPVRDNVLVMSDRQIPLNGPIITGTADFIVDRLSFMNNQNDEAPIFLVIDDCPGGSLMQGDRIIRAMQASKAPVFVVVTNFAASMAAVILAEADRALVYQNAIILHHQPWSGMFGNIAEQREWVDIFQQWGQRLHAQTANRMGISVDELYQLMYEKSVTGDWQEFGDQAVALKWADAVIDRIVDQGVRQRPEGQEPWRKWFDAWSQGELSRGAVPLPELGPYDGYFLYDPLKQYSISR